MKKILLPILFSCCVAKAQWNTNPAVNNAICIQPNEQINVKHISDLKGGAIVVWEDYRNDATNTRGDIYAQRINAVGNVMWTLNGVPICTDTSNQAAPTVVTDSAGGAIIVWQDHRGTKRNLYAQRIDSSGNVQWAANGVGVTLRNFDQKNPKIMTDAANGAFVFWQDSVSNIDYDIYGQHLDANGNQLWSGGVGVGTGLGSQVNVKGVIDANLNIFLSWQDKRNGSDYDVYVQKLNSAGVAQWTANGVNICNLAGTQSGPRPALDNTGGVIFVWQDKRNGLDYDIYAQRLNASGVAQWAANGKAVAVFSGNQTAVDLTSKGVSNGVIFGWKDQRNGVSNTDVYGQMFDLTGTAQWTANGMPIANATYNQLNVNVTGDESGGAFFCYQDSSQGNWDIRSQRVSAAGTLLWTAGGADVGTATNSQTGPNVSLSDNGSSIYSFQDLRNGTDNDIYAFKLDASGAPVTTGIMQLQQGNISVAPNPSSGDVTFSLPAGLASEGFVLHVSGVTGNTVHHEVIKNTERVTLTDKLAPGMYLYTIVAKEKSISGKFIIEK